MGRYESQITANTSRRKTKKSNDEKIKMVLFEISSPFHPFYHSPAARRGCRRGNCQVQTGLWPSVWGGNHAMDLAFPVAASEIFSRSSDAAAKFNNGNGKLKREVTEDGGIRFTLPLDGFDMNGLEVKVEGGALKIRAKKEEKNDKGETVTTRMMKQTVSLPEGCDVDAMETSFEQDGVLAISIPKKAKAIESQTNEKLSQMTPETQENQKTVKDTPSERILASISVRGYAPEDLTVKVTNNGKSVEVSGKHEERSEDGECCSVSQFSRTFALPEDVEVDKIQSRMAEDGAELIVTALAVTRAAVEAEAEKNIPIQMEVEQSN